MEEKYQNELQSTNITISEAMKGLEGMKNDRDKLQQELLQKEKEYIHVAQTRGLMDGKLEQLRSQLMIEKERNELLSESSSAERKRLTKALRQLQGELTLKDEELKKVRALADQLRTPIASGALNA